ncbi:alpha/beta hydrolase [Persicobacter diffluens]|uniref:Alpha/beta hydrolase n=1 Tax=Persicobacter diffluens TaxID=981 RepID=A0AAN5AJ85_9BACT|nr:alpha/beta hydrolase [Persicobacter diffluens]
MSKYFYTTHGEGFPVIFLHGFCETSQIWEQWINLLPKSFQSIALDLPGFGKSDPIHPKSLEDIARYIADFMEEQGIEKTIMVGHSLGGYITLEFARLFPEKLKGFGLFHSTAYEDAEEKKKNRSKTIEFVREKSVAAFSKDFVKNLFAPANVPLMAKEIKMLSELAAETPKDTFCDYAAAMRDRADAKTVLEQFNRPIFMIAGKEDPAVSLQDSQMQARLSQYITLHQLDNVGHMGMFEAPEETAQMVAGFISAVSKF